MYEKFIIKVILLSFRNNPSMVKTIVLKDNKRECDFDIKYNL
ncbi:hypothetical protein XBO1_1300080 [Xenorhabdus bovienii str. oregonense]|uniref:Uncharacterized protein n=1 Tax=Xenorhabdus bovienii str. oregonense TaxID=1398202 RepID=A0A077P3R1_XENBV|nr:hypothetical protein XBO1_1300080 [Xenorhabdus bovienii str. oregonense]